MSPALQADSAPLSHQGSWSVAFTRHQILCKAYVTRVNSFNPQSNLILCLGQRRLQSKPLPSCHLCYSVGGEREIAKDSSVPALPRPGSPAHSPEGAACLLTSGSLCTFCWVSNPSRVHTVILLSQQDKMANFTCRTWVFLMVLLYAYSVNKASQLCSSRNKINSVNQPCGPYNLPRSFPRLP